MSILTPPVSFFASKAVTPTRRSTVQRMTDAFIESRRRRAAQYIAQYSVTKWTPGPATASVSNTGQLGASTPVEAIYADASGA